MKKFSVALLVFSALLLSACSSGKKAESTDSTSKQQIEAKKMEDSKKKKAAEDKKLAEEAEKKKQQEIAKKVLEADAAMKIAEANPTEENYTAVKKAFDAIPGGNPDLKKRLEAISAKLEEMKQQAAANQQPVQKNQTPQQEPSNPDPDFIDADGNGFDDRSVFNDPAARAEYARGEAEAQQQWEQQQNAADQLDQYRADFKAQNGREPTSGEIQSQWLQEQGLSGGY